jgi:hypothetical protein
VLAELAEPDLPLAEVTQELFEKQRFAYVRPGEVAAALGGGGQSFMAGFDSDRSIGETLDAVRGAIAERIDGSGPPMTG